MDTETLIKTIIDAAYRVRSSFMPGYLESIYENALIVELEDLGLKVQSQKPLSVIHKNRVIGEFKIDLLVEDSVIVEIKSVNQISSAHEMQLVNYLTITGINNGLLINFGNLEKLEVKRKFRLYRPKQTI
ncbi:MAG: GxxExxY protein [Paludibacteraceae bacterium]|jgi:GxxExxY protein|nr:GxxExxY protein [Paludibacteraceae bacterium]MBR5824759.1 GxxExxY protein [Paludibacteraceae bacterium]